MKIRCCSYWSRRNCVNVKTKAGDINSYLENEQQTNRCAAEPSMNHESRMFQCFSHHLVLFHTIPDFWVYCEFNQCFPYHSVSLILTQLVFIWFCLLSSQSSATLIFSLDICICLWAFTQKGSSEEDSCCVWGREACRCTVTAIKRTRKQPPKLNQGEKEHLREMNTDLK